MDHYGNRMVIKNGRVLDYRTGIEIGRILVNGFYIPHYPDPLEAGRRNVIKRIAQQSQKKNISSQEKNQLQEH